MDERQTLSDEEIATSTSYGSETLPGGDDDDTTDTDDADQTDADDADQDDAG